jgi:DNA-directed RNA polymerase specialized sigma24 family protein
MAEAAVFDAIESSEDVSQSSLVIETAKSMVRRRKKSARRLYVCALFPFELGRLFLLDPMLRDSFVLRILVGLPPEVCAGILEVSIPEIEDTLFAALQELPHLEKREHPRALAANPLTIGVNV